MSTETEQTAYTSLRTSL